MIRLDVVAPWRVLVMACDGRTPDLPKQTSIMSIERLPHDLAYPLYCQDERVLEILGSKTKIGA